MSTGTETSAAADAAEAAPAPAPTATTENKTSSPSAAAASTAADGKKPPAAKIKEMIKIIPAVKQEEPPKDPNKPTDRDVVMDQEQMQGTALLFDLIRFHYYLWYVNNEGDGHETSKKTKTKESIPTDPSQVDDVAKHLVKLMTDGKQYCLLGLHDVPRPFLVGEGRYFKKDPKDAEKYVRVENEDEILNYVATTILAQFKTLSQTPPPDSVIDAIKTLYKNTEPAAQKTEKKAAGKGEEETNTTSVCVGPRPVDVLLVPIDADQDDIVAYDQQTGNKRLLHLASQLVSGAELVESDKRVVAAATLTTSKADVEEADGTVVQKTPRFVLQNMSSSSDKTTPSSSSWRELDYKEIAEVATMFVFEIYREKGLNAGITSATTTTTMMVGLSDLEDVNNTSHQDVVAPGTSKEGIEHATTHDVLFGRGGMTNGHPGNRRFRDLIALHRPDYMGAQKTEKPKVARRIVGTIRHGNPIGRFLKRDEDGLWREVGDKVAAEKTSQGLRERSNAEKRRRSVERKQVEKEGGTVSKKVKRDSTSEYLNGPVPDFGTTIPLSLSMKPKDPEDEGKEGPHALAVDENGKVVVTKYDILFGRGGLTNHHPGNKKFRDYVNEHRSNYVSASKSQKPAVARVIVRAIRNGDPPGRFLRKNDNGDWVDVGDKRAAEKTSQALREKATTTIKKDKSVASAASAIDGSDGGDDIAAASKEGSTETVAMESSTTTNAPIPKEDGSKEKGACEV
mmetsp:Transcript_22649/g.53591  ORF Transcript_22649/g.53591 Transcript_22649/m.53591 type:complete len:736 (-) Transcript_22649:167-2374(-)